MKDGARFVGHGVAMAWESDEELRRLYAIEQELVHDPALFELVPTIGPDGVPDGGTLTISLQGHLLHQLAMAQLRREGGRGPVVMGEGYNLLTTVGATDFWLGLTGGAIAGGAYNNANATLGVGDSATAAAAGQTDLQAGANKLRVAMDATYPVLATNTAQYRMTTAAAQYVWAEWAVFNAAAAGRMLNRAVPGGTLGNKTGVGASWTLLVTLSLA